MNYPEPEFPYRTHEKPARQTERATYGPEDLGFVFDESSLPSPLAPEFSAHLGVVKSYVTDMLNNAKRSTHKRQEEQIRRGVIAKHDYLAQQAFLQRTQLEIFDSSPWLKRQSSNGPDTRKGEFHPQRFPHGWFLLDLNSVPLSTSPKLASMLQDFEAQIASGSLQPLKTLTTGVPEERIWGTTVVQFLPPSMIQPQTIQARVLVAYIHVSAQHVPGQFGERAFSLGQRLQELSTRLGEFSTRLGELSLVPGELGCLPPLFNVNLTSVVTTHSYRVLLGDEYEGWREYHRKQEVLR